MATKKTPRKDLTDVDDALSKAKEDEQKLRIALGAAEARRQKLEEDAAKVLSKTAEPRIKAAQEEFETIKAEITDLISQAETKVQELVAASEKHGVPFDFFGGYIPQFDFAGGSMYIPSTWDRKATPQDLVKKITGAEFWWDDEDDAGPDGWVGSTC